MQQAAPNVVAPAVGGMVAFFVLLWIAAIVIGIALTVLWLLAIIDCAQREFPGPNDKVMWILIIIFAHGLGALIYWYVGRPKGVKPA